MNLCCWQGLVANRHFRDIHAPPRERPLSEAEAQVTSFSVSFGEKRRSELIFQRAESAHCSHFEFLYILLNGVS
jgi:hypothetical protein